MRRGRCIYLNPDDLRGQRRISPQICDALLLKTYPDQARRTSLRADGRLHDHSEPLHERNAMTLCIAKLGHDEPNPMHSIPCNKQLPAMPIPPRALGSGITVVTWR